MKLTQDELLLQATVLRFTSRTAVDTYLADDKIECLICGKHYINLGSHVAHHHGVSARAYKRAFNIPRKCGLMGLSLRSRLSEIAHLPERLEQTRILGLTYGHGNGGHHTPGPHYESQPPKKLTHQPPELLTTQTPLDFTMPRQEEPVRSLPPGYDRKSVVARVERLEELLQSMSCLLNRFMEQSR